MSDLDFKERELVAIGAALGANCVPCIEYHVPEARKAGLTDAQIAAAITLADKIRKVPAAKVLSAALAAAGSDLGTTEAGGSGCESQTAEPAAGKCC